MSFAPRLDPLLGNPCDLHLHISAFDYSSSLLSIVYSHRSGIFR